MGQWPASISGMTDQVETQTRTSKGKPLQGKNTVSIYLELHGLDDVADDAFQVESDKTNVSLAIASVAGKQRIFKLTGLAHEITGVKVAQRKNKTDVLPEAREEGREDLAQVAR